MPSDDPRKLLREGPSRNQTCRLNDRFAPGKQSQELYFKPCLTCKETRITQKPSAAMCSGYAYRNSSSWLVNSEQSAPTLLITMKALCLLSCRILDEAFRPHDLLAERFVQGFCSFKQTPSWFFRPGVPKFIFKEWFLVNRSSAICKRRRVGCPRNV